MFLRKILYKFFYFQMLFSNNVVLTLFYSIYYFEMYVYIRIFMLFEGHF